VVERFKKRCEDSLDSFVGQTIVSIFHHRVRPTFRIEKQYLPSAKPLSTTLLLTNLSLLKNVPGHDTHLAGLRNNTGAVSSNHSRLVLRLERIVHSNLIPLGDPLGDGYNELDLVFDGLDDGVGSARRRNIDD
jgi:hypothetical protein